MIPAIPEVVLEVVMVLLVVYLCNGKPFCPSSVITDEKGKTYIFFLYRSGGRKPQGSFLKTLPRAHANRPGAPFYARKIVVPPGAFNNVITESCKGLAFTQIPVSQR